VSCFVLHDFRDKPIESYQRIVVSISVYSRRGVVSVGRFAADSEMALLFGTDYCDRHFSISKSDAVFLADFRPDLVFHPLFAIHQPTAHAATTFLK